MGAELRHVALDGAVGLFVPVDACPAVVALLEAACTSEARRCGPGWSPQPPVVELLRKLRLAPLLADLTEVESSEPGTPEDDVGEHGLVTATEAADLLGVSSRLVRRRASKGALPGARRVGGRWLIPAEELETL